MSGCGDEGHKDVYEPRKVVKVAGIVELGLFDALQQFLEAVVAGESSEAGGVGADGCVHGTDGGSQV